MKSGVDGRVRNIPTATFLEDTQEALQADEALVKYLGHDLVNTCAALKQNELTRYSNHVTDWEITEYAELF